MVFDTSMLIVTIYYMIVVPSRLTFFSAPGLTLEGLDIIDVGLTALSMVDLLVRYRILEKVGAALVFDLLGVVPIGPLVRLFHLGTASGLQNGLVRNVQRHAPGLRT